MLILIKLWIFVTLVVSVGRARAQDADRTFCFDITSCKDCLDRSCAWAPVAGCLSSCWDIADTACYSPDRYSASEVCDKPVEPETGLWWPAATASPTELDELDPSECPKGCCEEDCCGPDTFYDAPFCQPSRGKPGFTGVYSNPFEEGCIPRACCESDCCGKGTVYDEIIAFCVPTDRVADAFDSPIMSPSYFNAPYYMNSLTSADTVGDGSLESVCFEDNDCYTNHCYKGMQFSGFKWASGSCACNPATSSGCEGEHKCYFYSGALGISSGAGNPPPECFLPFGASCTAGEWECITGYCDVTGKCTCNITSNWPCDVANGEICMEEPNGKGRVCKMP